MAAGTAPTANQIAIYDADGNLIAANCRAGLESLACGDGSSAAGLILPELTGNGAHDFRIYGAELQAVDGCIVLAGQPAAGQVLRGGEATATIDGKTCRVMIWTTDLDIAGLETESTPDGAADFVLTYDASTGVNKKLLLANIAFSAEQLPNPTPETKGAVKAKDCGATSQFVQAINGDASITCGTPGGSGGSGSTTFADNESTLPARSIVSSGPGIKAADNAVSDRTDIRLAWLREENYIKEQFATDTANVNQNGYRMASVTTYSLANVSGSGATLIPAASPPPGIVGAWEMSVTPTSGSQAILERRVSGGTDMFPAASAAPYTYETHFALKEAANNYAAVGVKSVYNYPGGQFTTGIGIWCDVTNEGLGSPGTWACHTRAGGVTVNASVIAAPVADTAAHSIRFVVTNSQITYWYDGVQMGTSTTGIPAISVSPAWTIKTTEAASKALTINGWIFSMKR